MCIGRYVDGWVGSRRGVGEEKRRVGVREGGEGMIEGGKEG